MNKKIEDLNIVIPDNIDKVIDSSINRIKKERRKKTRAIAASIVAISIVGITLPVYAGDLPVFNEISQFFKELIYENYDTYASNLNITKESNGLKVTVNKVIYDGIDLSVFYTVEGAESAANLFVEKLKVDGEEVSFGSSTSWEKVESYNTVVGNITYGVGVRNMLPEEVQNNSFGGYVEIPDQFNLTFNINSIDTGNEVVNGNWKFDIPVTNAKLLDQIKEYEVNEIVNVDSNIQIEKIVTTPINTSIQGSYLGEEFLDIQFVAFDKEGNYLPSKGLGQYGTGTTGGYKNYFNATFQEVNSEEILLIPYKNKSVYENIKINDYGYEFTYDGVKVKINNTKDMESAPFEMKADLNLSGVTELKTIMDNEFSKINKIEVENSKTILYIDSSYSVYGIPYAIRNKATGEEFTAVDDLDYMELTTTKYIADTNELIVQYNGELQEGEYEVLYYDHTGEKIFYNNEILKIKF